MPIQHPSTNRPQQPEPPDRSGPAAEERVTDERATELALRFEAHRGHLRAVAYRMLGSRAEAEDAVQETWLRLSRSASGDVANLGGWLTTVVGRVCLDLLRSRRSRRAREQAVAGPAADASGSSGAAGPAGRPPDGAPGPADPEGEALLADEVGLALLVVLDRLGPVERVVFVLHDLFAVPFAEIAPIVERSEATTKRLASRARHRVRGGDPAAVAPASLTGERALVDAFLAATRRGDLEALLTLLAPDVVRRADLAAVAPGKPIALRGARAVAEETAGNAARARFAAVAVVDGAVGIVVAPAGHLVVALRLTLGTRGDADGRPRITEIDTIADPARLAALDLAILPR